MIPETISLAVSPVLALEQVSLSLPTQSTPLLYPIDWIVTPGQCWGLLGRSGAGKSCLLRLLNRLSEPTAGCIYFQGQNICQLNVYGLRRQVMLVPPEPKLLGMTVEQALIYPLELAKLPTELVQERLESWCDRLQLSSVFLQRDELQLSSGDRHWVSLCRALIMQPKVLLLDESLSALEAEQIDQFMAIQEQLQLTVILASRHKTLIQQCCAEVAWLEQGKMIAQAPNAVFDWCRWQESKMPPTLEDWPAEE